MTEAQNAHAARSIETDVVIVGSGAAGLTAAIVAHDHGAEVVVLEKTSKVGGTSAMSGGGVWIPLNHHIPELGGSDTREDALNYCLALAGSRADPALVEAFVDNGHKMVRYIEEATRLRFRSVNMPDYRPEVEGGHVRGRSLEPEIFGLEQLGESKHDLRRSGIFLMPITVAEMMETYQAFYRPQSIPQDLMVERMLAEQVTLGGALMAPLFEACRDRAIPILLDVQANKLHITNGHVTGLGAKGKDGPLTVMAKRGVILASGGFEWNTALTEAFLPGPLQFPNSLPALEGDGLVMAMEAGAALGSMTEIWGYPSGVVPGEEYEGRPMSRPIKAERAAPHCILVNGRGVRFANEAANYNDLAKAFNAFDVSTATIANMPCWAIFDQQYRDTYSVLTAMAGDPDPNWLIAADSLSGLAEKINVPPAALQSTVERWNGMVENGVDTDFHRGESAFDQFQGDHLAPNPCMGSIERAPFYALEIFAGTLGTKGGPKTNAQGQIIDQRGQPIQGLFGAGNVIAAPTGSGYYGPGGTIGPAMTWGYLCGIHAANNNRSASSL